MPRVLFDRDAGKQTVSITLNSDLYAKAKSIGINTSQVAEKASAAEYVARTAETLTAELQRDLAAVELYVDQHGSFADFARDYYEHKDAAV